MRTMYAGSAVRPAGTGCLLQIVFNDVRGQPSRGDGSGKVPRQEKLKVRLPLAGPSCGPVAESSGDGTQGPEGVR
jgi:hypothetical protein